jgi:hypothetical protein
MKPNAFPSILSALFHAVLFLGVCWVLTLVILGFLT